MPASRLSAVSEFAAQPVQDKFHTFGTEPDHIDGLCMLNQSAQVGYLPLLPCRFDFPELDT